VWENRSYGFRRAGSALVLSNSRDVGPGVLTAPTLINPGPGLAACFWPDSASPLQPVPWGTIAPLAHNLATGRFDDPPLGCFQTNEPLAFYLAPSPLGYSPPADAGIVQPFFGLPGCPSPGDITGGCLSACSEAVRAWVDAVNCVSQQPAGNTNPPPHNSILAVSYRHRIDRQMFLRPFPGACQVTVVFQAWGVIFSTVSTRVWSLACGTPLPLPPPPYNWTAREQNAIDRPYAMPLPATNGLTETSIALDRVGSRLYGALDLGGGARIEVST
jgi:hypothetical protein